MEKYYSQLIGTPIITDAGQTAGHLCDLVFNPDNGKVIGFIVAPNGQKVISPMDILQLEKKIYIHDVEDILHTEDIHQVAQILNKRIRIYKSKVVTQKGLYLGHVIDFAIHDKFFILTKIMVAKKILKIFYFDKKIISSNDIIEIKKDKIIVKDPLQVIPLKKLSIDAAPTV